MHAKNFKNIKEIALAKSEIIHNTKSNGFIILMLMIIFLIYITK